MAWVVTLEFKDCADQAVLGGTMINDGYNLFYADVNGRFIAIVDDMYTGYIISVSRAGYSTLSYALSNTMNGQTKTVCLNKAATTTNPSGGYSGGW